MSEERTIKGIIVNWTRQVETSGKFHKRGVLIKYSDGPVDGKVEGWHNISLEGDDAAQTLQKLNNLYPKGSSVHFLEVQKGKYWNFKKGSLKAANEEISKQKVQDYQQKDSDRQELIVRQTCLKMATEAVIANGELRHKVLVGTSNNNDDILKQCLVTPRRISSFAKRLRKELECWDEIPNPDKNE